MKPWGELIKRFFQNNAYLIVFNITLVVIFFPITFQQAIFFDTSDYAGHFNAASFILETGKFVYMNRVVPHPLLHFFILFFNQVFGFSIAYGAIITILLTYVLLGDVIYSQLIKEKASMAGWKGMLVSTGMIIAGPLFIYFFSDQLFYFGYIGFASYHNPTIILLRPLALILWILTAKNILTLNLSIKYYIFGILTIVLASIAKPSYTICILPAIGLAILWQMVRKGKVNWSYTILAFFLPAFLVLGWQYVLTFQSQVRDSTILFAPFKVISWMTDKILQKYILSMIFPLSVSLVYFRKALRDRSMMIAWIVFGIGTIYGYLLAESGKSMYSGNFIWSTDITLFILFFQSVIFFIGQKTVCLPQKLISATLWSIIIAQVVFGIIYYIHCFINPIYI